MAIKIQGPPIAGDNLNVVKEFTDRTKPRRAFWDRYVKMVKEGSTIITFYGAGGVGKSALLEKLEDEIKQRDKGTGKQCKYIKYDFSRGTDVHKILEELKTQLSAYGCEFPFFDSGNYYYALKVGKNIRPLKAKSMMQEIPWVKKISKKLRTADNAIYRTYPFLRVARGFLEVADGIFQATAIPRAITTCFSVVDSMLRYYMELNEFVDKYHEEVRNQLNARREKKNSSALYEYLPTLFAMDVADWVKRTKTNLVVMFDNYESLISATSLATTEQLKRDLWLRGSGGLIFMIPNTLWTIAGRNKLHWDGELGDEAEQHLITALSIRDANSFLKNAGIADKKLRDKLVKMTKGYPIFLNLCADVYAEHKHRYNSEPKISAFGHKRKDVVDRIFRYLDENNDDIAKDMVEFLCALNIWTDELVFDIGGAVLPNFSHNTYKRVKEFSFIQADFIRNDDIKLEVYRFDDTIQNILLETCNAVMIAKMRDAVDKYFKKFFMYKKILDARDVLYLKLWAEFVARFAESDVELLTSYKETFAGRVSSLTSKADFDAAEKILTPFMSAVEDVYALTYTYFQMDLGWLRRSQGKYNEAYKLTNSAYETRKEFLGTEDVETVKAMHKLAITLRDLGRYDEAADLQEKVLAWRKKNSGDEHPDTISAMSNLAISLNNLRRHKEAVPLQEQVLTIRQKKFGDEHIDTLAAMNNLALSLSALGHHDKAIPLQEKVLAARQKKFGDEHPDMIAAMSNLAISLSGCGLNAEALKLRRKVLTLSEKVLGDEHPETLNAINNLALSFSAIGQNGAAEIRQRQALTLYEKILGAEHPNTLTAINNLIVTLTAQGQHDEIAALQEKILTARQEKFGDEHPETLDAMNNLAWTLTLLERYDKALTLTEKALPLYKKILGDEHANTFCCADTMAHALNGLGRRDEALTLQRDNLTRCEKIFGKDNQLTAALAESLADVESNSVEHERRPD